MNEILNDPVLLVCGIAFILCIVMIIIGLVRNEKKNKQGIPAYTYELIYNEILQQYMIVTKHYNFGVVPKESVQSNLLKKELPIGLKKVYENADGETMELTIASHRKIYVPSITGETPYQIYFKEYQGIEFPKDITIPRNEKYTSISFKEKGFELHTLDNVIERYEYDWIEVKHLNEFVSVFRKNRSRTEYDLFRFVIIDNRHLYENRIALHSDDYKYVCEVLQKYCDWAWV